MMIEAFEYETRQHPNKQTPGLCAEYSPRTGPDGIITNESFSMQLCATRKCHTGY